MNLNRFDVAVVGAGILGLAHACAAARQGLSVIVFERLPKASGASVRNFGMIWPIGQPPGAMHQLALRSRLLWLDLLESGRFPYNPTGSVHAMFRKDEADVAREFAELAPGLGYDCRWLDAPSTLARSRAVSSRELIGSLWSPTEFTVDPRAVAAWLPCYLEEQHSVQFRFDCAVHSIDLPKIHAGNSVFFADAAIVCGGDDFATLYPEAFRKSGITRCKLQMMRTVEQPDGWQLGPSIAGGLTLQHNDAFRICTSLETLKRRIATETPEINRWGIHILASQTPAGEVTVGDSHEYGMDVDVFDKMVIDHLICDHAEQLLCIPDWSIAQRWHGVYAKHPAKPFVAMTPAERVRIVTAPGGAGMTLSFGLGEQTVQEMRL